ncbi:carbohydrate binding domain-containing protein [Cohnella cholangitidis]|uniref:Alpha-amylase n=1 Tax=Cohnella cholangitidis TaxID=2598458 RepID=A0A7G5C014_9BACL|nr:carbohydrate binding domain-containing protein [Cohnella cholangitidis]QMV42548.1 alpha-amylase [Cohnella cholangitidis]
MRIVGRKIIVLLASFIFILAFGASAAFAEISATHVYHNHMPNFWAYYNTSGYNSTAVGSPIRYTYDGQVIELKKNPPAGYTYFNPKNGTALPHDDLVSYYTHNAKTGAYLYWSWQVADSLNKSNPSGQVQVTMSAAVVNNVNSFMTTNNVPGYNNANWGLPWKTAYNNLKTPNGNRTLDVINFSGHHSMGPLTGNDYLLKDLIYQRTTLSQSYFLGDSFTASKGFFPTELGFSERIIPVLDKLGIQWSVIGNNHFSRTLTDYPYLNDPGKDTMVSPPNRADLQNTSTVGSWVEQPMFNEKQVTYNKFPFASTPHWVRYVDPGTGKENRVVGVPVAQAESWEEGYQGSAKATVLKSFEGLLPQKQFFVIAHDGDNSSGRAGSEDTWRNAANVTYADSGVKAEGISEYLVKNTPAASDVVHVQDGSWIDTRDSSSDPTWYHWRLPFGIWKGQFSAFNTATGLNLAPKKNLNGVEDGMTVSFEYGYHYLERNFALLQAAENYAKTAEQIWLDDHPNYWQPTSALDKQVTYSGNQLNPWMLSYPVKGDAANDYKGGANPAELGWYFLLPAMDSGFGYYDENVDDGVKPTLSFNNSLYFTKPYVTSNKAKDKTGPNVWWPQRYPYNPGSANVSKAEGWTLQYYDNTFGIYTYAYDVSGISDIKLKVRTHRDKTASALDNTFRVYDPAALKAQGVQNIDPAKVGSWVEYPMNKRDLKPDINGVAWQPESTAMFKVVPAQEIGDLYYTYLSNYRDQMLDYYIETVDNAGNVTKSEIQTVYVGAGKYSKDASGKIVEDANGTIQGTYPFLVIDKEAPSVPANLQAANTTDRSVSLTWAASTDNVGVSAYEVYRDGVKVGTASTAAYTDAGLTASTSYVYTVKALDKVGNISLASSPLTVMTKVPDNEPPAAPTDLTNGAKTASTIQLSWTAATDNYGVLGYDIYRNGTKVGNTDKTTYTDSDLSPNTTYDYYAKAIDAAGNASAASIILSVKTESGNVVTIYYKQGYTTPYIHYRPIAGTWTTSPGVLMPQSDLTGYNKITLNVGTASGAEVVFNNGSGTWDNNGGKNYTFQQGIWTFASGTITAGVPTGIDTAAPTAPTNLQATAKTQTSVTLTWSASTDNVGVTGYEIYRNGVKVGTSAATTYVNSGLTAGTAYTFTVKAYDAAGNLSAAGTALEVTTEPLDSVAPTVPTNVQSTAKTHNSITLSWSASTDNVGVTGYEIYRNSAKVGTSATTTYVDNNLAAATAYTYMLKAYDALGNTSEASSELQVTTNAAPLSNKATIYYKRGYSTPYFHYAPTGGAWTAVPGIAMQASEFTGYSVITVDIGTATSLAAVFNNGGGTWDNNGGKNYSFQQGIWTFANGTITAGPPEGSIVDTLAPTEPTNVQATAKTHDSVTLSWSASTDNVGVTGYEIYRNGFKIGTSTQTTFTDTGLTAQTAYTYTVKAYDAKANMSVASSGLLVTTNAVPLSNTATIYYKQGFSSPYIYYMPTGGAWTALPGVAMQPSAEYAGYSVITVNLGTATSMKATFNNGSGTWDNNGGNNYTFEQGTWTFENGKITSGAPVLPQTQSLTIKLTVPMTTAANDSVYIAGSFNNWNPADSNYKLTPNSDGTYSITMSLMAGTTIQYKFLRGSWATVEANSNNSDIANRSYTMPNSAQTLTQTVVKWKDK